MFRGDFTGSLGCHSPLKIFLAPSLTLQVCRKAQNFEFQINGLLQIFENQEDIKQKGHDVSRLLLYFDFYKSSL